MSYLNNTYAVFNDECDKVAVIAINHQQGGKDVSIVVTSCMGVIGKSKAVLSDDDGMGVIVCKVREALCDALVSVGYGKAYLDNVSYKYSNDVYDFEPNKAVNVCCDMLIVKQ